MKTAKEIIDGLPKDLRVARVMHPSGMVVDVRRKHLIEGLKRAERSTNRDQLLTRTNWEIAKAERGLQEGRPLSQFEHLTTDLAIWFVLQLLSGEIDISEVTRPN